MGRPFSFRLKAFIKFANIENEEKQQQLKLPHFFHVHSIDGGIFFSSCSPSVLFIGLILRAIIFFALAHFVCVLVQRTARFHIDDKIAGDKQVECVLIEKIKY